MAAEKVLEELGLSPAEIKIFLILIKQGAMNISEIAKASGIHRRNVYDASTRLLGKGLILQVLSSRESIYEAVPPTKLLEIHQEREKRLRSILPKLEKAHSRKASREEVYILKGVEGYRSYLRQVLNVGKSLFVLGAKGLPHDPKIASFVEQYKGELKAKKIKVQRLF